MVEPDRPTVNAPAGAYVGTRRDGVFRFGGIRYARAPVGPLRWRAPVALRRADGPVPALSPGPRCPQTDRLGDIDPFNPRMDEDCLFLNIWTPGPGAASLPVLVWIHGGNFTIGSGSEPWYDGAALAARGCVFVTINYRLGAFGFLAHPALNAEQGGVSGNYGLLDQVAALEWLQDNVAAFGGDPSRVTLVGESAGAIAISLLMTAPRARGLFHGAICQSGSALYAPASPYAMWPLERAQAVGAARWAEWRVSTLDAARALPAGALLAPSPAQEAQFTLPIIDGRLIPEEPGARFETAGQADVPLLAGYNRDEGSLFALRPQFAALDLEQRIAARFGARAEEAQGLYGAHGLADFLGDELVGHAVHRLASLHARTAVSPVYRYLFDHRPPAPDLSLTPLAAPGAFHSAEITYALGTHKVRDWPWRAEDWALAEEMQSRWLDFAAQGRMDPARLPAWPEYLSGGEALFRLGCPCGAMPDPHAARLALLDHV